VPQPARLRWLRNSVLRRSASFLFFVARMERSEIRERHGGLLIVPGFCGACHRAGHFGPDPLASSGLRIGPDRDEAGHHHRLYLTKVGF